METQLFKKCRQTTCIILGLFLGTLPILGQADTKVIERSRDIVLVEETTERTNVIFPGGSVEVNHFGDTITKISVGCRRFEVVEDASSGRTRIRMVHIPRKRFKGHWAGFDLGLNNFFSEPFDSNLPDDAYFMDLNTGKSVMAGLNLLQHNIGLQKHRTNIGLITGLGITWHNYRFDSQRILTKDENGHTSYYLETERNVSKNKLTTSFLTIPVLVEFQFPSSHSVSPVFINGGFYGGFRLGSHTKVVYDGGSGRDKEKSREDLNLNSFKYGVTVRAGYRFVKLFATCDLTTLFQAGQGPELYPWSVGMTLVSF